MAKTFGFNDSITVHEDGRGLDFEGVKQQVNLKEFADEYLERSGNSYVCPYCGSGTHENRTPAFSIYNAGGQWKWSCFACDRRAQDVYDLAGGIIKSDDKREQFEFVAAYAGIDVEDARVNRSSAGTTKLAPVRTPIVTGGTDPTEAARYEYRITFKDSGIDKAAATPADVFTACRRPKDDESAPWVRAGTGPAGRGMLYRVERGKLVSDGTTDETAAWELDTAALESWKAANGYAKASPLEGKPSAGGGTEGTEQGKERERGRIRESQAAMFDYAHPEGLAYMRSRGFTDEETRAYGIGYDVQQRRVVIPWSTDGDEFRHLDRDVTGRARYKYMAPKKEDVGGKVPWHMDDADGASTLWVVEGAFDAMALQLMGARAVACCGKDEWPAVAKELERRRFGGMVIAQLDFDPDARDGSPTKGRVANGKLVEELHQHGIDVMEADPLPNGAKDAADVLKEDREALRAYVEVEEKNANAYRAQLAEEAVRKAEQVLGLLDPAWVANDIYNLRNAREPIPTGFPRLDEALNGGLRQGLYTLGAVPSLGKTTFMVQLADNLAAAGNLVLFVTIEQSAEELVSKSASRLMASIDGEAVSATSIMSRERRGRWTEDRRATFDEAMAWYVENVAPNLRYKQADEQIGVKDVVECAEVMRAADKAAAEAEGREARTPIVVIDYLQLLAPQDPHDTDKRAVDRNVMGLRQLARDCGTTVLCISNLNRSSYQGAVDIDSFKESGAVEYSADVLMGLQPANITEELEDVSEVKKKSEGRRLQREHKHDSVRKCELVILKNRNGALGTVPMTYVPVTNTFSDGAGGR